MVEFDLVALVKDLGLPVALVCYFCLKDWKFTGQLVVILTEIKECLKEKVA